MFVLSSPYFLYSGFVLKKLTKLIASFLDVDTIKQKYKSRLVGTVLNGYLALRRLVVQRTRIIDETQEKLLELLEEMTSGRLRITHEKFIFHFLIKNRSICLAV